MEGRLISLQRRTFACSPPDRTLTRLSICLGCKAAFCEGGTHLILAVARKLLPDLLDTGCGNILTHFLLEIADLQIIPLLYAAGEGIDQTEDALQQSCLTDSVCTGDDDLGAAFHGQIQRGRTAARHNRLRGRTSGKYICRACVPL